MVETYREFYAIDDVTYEITGYPPTVSDPVLATVRGVVRLAGYDYRFTVNLCPAPRGGWQAYIGGPTKTGIERGPNTRAPSPTALQQFADRIIPAAIRVANEHADAIARTAAVIARMRIESLELRAADERAAAAHSNGRAAEAEAEMAQARAFLNRPD